MYFDENLGTQGAERGCQAGIIPKDEAARQTDLLKTATALEKKRGMTASAYLSPAQSPTKLAVCKKITETISSGGKVAVVMLAKKELAYRFADMFLAVDDARKKLGGSTFFVANLDREKGLPRIRESSGRYDPDLRPFRCLSLHPFQHTTDTAYIDPILPEEPAADGGLRIAYEPH